MSNLKCAKCSNNFENLYASISEYLTKYKHHIVDFPEGFTESEPLCEWCWEKLLVRCQGCEKPIQYRKTKKCMFRRHNYRVCRNCL